MTTKFEDLTEDKKNRLHSIYQTFLFVVELEEEKLPEGEEFEVDETNAYQVARKVIQLTEESGEEMFEYELITISEVVEAFEHGPRLDRESTERFCKAAGIVLEKWEQEFPECETLGEMMASRESAGRA